MTEVSTAQKIEAGASAVTPAIRVRNLVKTYPGRPPVEAVRGRLQASLTDVEVLTPAEFRDRSRSFWLFDTGAGAALFFAAFAAAALAAEAHAQKADAQKKMSFFVTSAGPGKGAGELRQAVAYHYLADLPYAEIAVILDSSVAVTAEHHPHQIVVAGRERCCRARRNTEHR